MKKLKLGIAGLGQRGASLLKNVILAFDDVEIVAVCDELDFRVKEAKDAIKEKKGYEPQGFVDYREVLKLDLDAFIIMTAWESHVPLAIASMEAGIPTAMEVGGAYSVEDCYALVAAYERTKTPFMFLENCCFSKDELLATAMLRKGLFGELVYAEGAYAHDLRDEVARGEELHHYRLRNYLARNCENYPTHELLPIAKAMNINRGNRMLSLVSMASKAAGLHQYIADNKDKIPEHLHNATFAQGDVVDTIIKCAGGETIHLTLDTTLPRYYDRKFTLRGTKGMYTQTLNAVIIDGVNTKEYFEPTDSVREYLNNAKEYEEEYLPAIWKAITPEMLAAGHGGMDAIEFSVFFDAIREGKEMPLDVYDAATVMVISALTEQSIAMGGAPVAIPDFTHGAWIYREKKDVLPL